VSAAVALAFADASIVVLGLPQIIERLHTTIPHVIWVIAAYNAALIVGALMIMTVGSRLPSERALIAGLLLFGLASLAAGVADSFRLLVGLRVVQGLGGALLLVGSLPRLAGAVRSGESPLAGWAAAAAVGAALGPAAGGLLTDIFDWRAIFLAQAPVAALAALAIGMAPKSDPEASAEAAGINPTSGRGEVADRSRRILAPMTANIALALISAALIGALFLVTVLLINVWGLTPLGAAAVLTVIPVATTLADRLTRGRSPVRLGATGAVVLAAGLVVLALISHRELGLALVALALCGAGLGLSYPPLTDAAIESSNRPAPRVARTVAARDAGLILGLLVLTPIFVNQLNTAPRRAIPPITKAVITAPVPLALKIKLGAGLLQANAKAHPSQLPNIDPAFARVSSGASPATRAELSRLRDSVQSLIQRAATDSFRRPLIYCAIFALLVLPLLLPGVRDRPSRSPRPAMT